VTKAGAAHAATLAALAALDADPTLRDAWVLKGGLVLRHVYASPRDSEDLDLNHVEPHANVVTDEHTRDLRGFVGRLRVGTAAQARRFGLDRAGVRIDKWSRALPTVFCLVHWRLGADAGAVPLQATLSEVVCGTVRARVEGVPVLATRIEDTVADKLKALLQQVPRHQVRPSDVFDLWYALEQAPMVPEPNMVATCLVQKVAPWPELRGVTSEKFREPAVRSFAEAGFRKLRAQQPDLEMPPFDQVWERLMHFVGSLPLPDAGDATSNRA
jgi:hypothetical protein